MPAELTRGPFKLEDALRAGLERWHVEGASGRRMGPNVYVWAGLPDTMELKLEAARLRLPPAAVFSGLTAAWLHGLDVGACEPIEVTLPKGIGISARSGLEVRRAAVSPKDVVSLGGKRATSIGRTLSDLCIRLSVTEAVVVTDMALRARLVRLADLKALCVTRARRFGVASLRHVVGWAEPAPQSRRWSRACGCCWCSGVWPGRRCRYRCMTPMVAFSAGPISTTRVIASRSNTESHIGPAWSRTTAGRIA